MPTVSIDDFVKGLAALPEPDFIPERVYSYIATHSILPDSLRPYLFFSPAHYTRNLIFKNDLFEAVAIGWDIGQVSMIHNHRDQNCWMAVPMGRLKNQNYRVIARNEARGYCRLAPTSSCLITPASPLQVDPDEPVHQVLNPAEFGERAVSIHIYSRPFDTCEVYSLEKNTFGVVTLRYTSEYGRLCADEVGKIECPPGVST